MIVKSQSIAQQVADLKAIFREFRKYNMRLNMKNVFSRSAEASSWAL